jgi:hypothetical protein
VRRTLSKKGIDMEIILGLAGMLAVVGVTYASTSDMHTCTQCKGVSSDEYGGMQISQGKRTIFNPRGDLWTHTSCASFRTKN